MLEKPVASKEAHKLLDLETFMQQSWYNFGQNV